MSLRQRGPIETTADPNQGTLCSVDGWGLVGKNAWRRPCGGAVGRITSVEVVGAEKQYYYAYPCSQEGAGIAPSVYGVCHLHWWVKQAVNYIRSVDSKKGVFRKSLGV